MAVYLLIWSMAFTTMSGRYPVGGMMEYSTRTLCEVRAAAINHTSGGEAKCIEVRIF